VLQACLVAWAATDAPEHAKTALRFFDALLDDLDRVGDRGGGDKSAQRDSGYAIRNLGPYTALAYDWLHDKLSPEQRAKARRRWAAWLAWYREHGYRARTPGSNYHAGYLVSATSIAIAQGGEAGEESTLLWQYVADELWGKDMAAAFAAGGILDGGDWPEGWQYGPLAVTSYALSARVARRAGISIEGVDVWLASLLRRHVYGLTPDDKVWPGGDTEAEVPHLDPYVNTLNAISLGDASPETKRWAKGELSRLQLADRDFLLHDALATVGDKPALVPRAEWPTWYLAAATGTLFARTRWDASAVWFVAECQHSIEIDHRHPKTGNFALSRGKDHVIVDPSPYGSASTMTSNAPTVASGHLPANYIPSQGSWGESSGWRWTTQTRSGVVAARCDYADQFKFQHRASDVPHALRDFVLLPGNGGKDAALVIVDRASTTSEGRPMHLRFRSPSGISLDGDLGTAKVGDTQLAIASVARTGGTPETARPTAKDCWKAEHKGKCDAARFPVGEFRVAIPGPDPRATHVITALAAGVPTSSRIGDQDWSGVHVGVPRDSFVVWPHEPRSAFTYRTPSRAATHVVLDAPETAGKASVTAKVDGAQCAISVAPGGTFAAKPLVVSIDGACNVSADPEAASAAAAIGTRPSPVHKPGATTRRAGCCGAQTTPSSPIATSALVGVLLLRRRKRARA
jgi:hypothetical protein